MSSIFPTPRIYRHRRDGVEHPRAGRGRRIWVLSRALCRYRSIPLIDDPSPSRRLAALELKIAEWSPYAATGRLVQEDGRRAGVWIWDRHAVEATILDAGERPNRVTILPEAAMQPRGTDGLRHLRTWDGYEAQLWIEGLMAASRWWPEAPSAAAWRQFLRAASVPAEALANAEAAQPAALAPLSRPWISASTSGRRVRINWPRAYLAMAAAYLLLIGAFAGQIAREQRYLHRLEGEIAAAEAAAEPRARDRAEARSALEAAKGLLALAPYPSQLDLLDQVSAVLPQNGARLTDWSFQHGELEFALSSPLPVDVVAAVKALEANPRFGAVATIRSNDDRALKVKLKVAAQ